MRKISLLGAVIITGILAFSTSIYADDMGVSPDMKKDSNLNSVHMVNTNTDSTNDTKDTQCNGCKKCSCQCGSTEMPVNDNDNDDINDH